VKEAELMNHPPRSSTKRSVLKAVTYRVAIICLDFVSIYLLTGKPMVALGFMIVSNVYTTVGYFIHERIWAGIGWGIEGGSSPQPVGRAPLDA
jgi:uncharacterized membrane protein